jgi:hypothetical protein
VATKKIKEFKKDHDVMIHYNPEKPKESYIKPTSNFIIQLIKYLPLIITLPMAISVLIWQVKTLLRSFKSEY